MKPTCPRCRWQLGLIVATLAGLPAIAKPFGSPALEAALERRDDIVYFTDFESEAWIDDWSEVSHRDNMRLVDPTSDHLRRGFHGKALEIAVKQGEHYGMSAKFKFKEQLGYEPDELYVRFYTCFADDFLDRPTGQGYRGKGPGFDGTYNREGWGGSPNSDGTKGWSCRGANSATDQGGIRLSFYSYAVKTGSYNYGQTLPFDGQLEPQRWYCVEQYLRLNTPGEPDGIARAWIDGKQVFDRDDFLWRKTAKLKIYSYWIDYYCGGKQPANHDHHIYLDNLVIATARRVGKFTAGSVPAPQQ